jgi:pimeloyl-ACP methyl ester carboxylesterase
MLRGSFASMKIVSAESGMKSKIAPRAGRVLARTVGGALLVLGTIEIFARADIRRNRAERAPLGDALFVDERGAGDPIVFIAGLQGSTRYWGDRYDLLATEHRLILVDLLGFGRSPWPAGVDYTLEDQLAWLRRTLVRRKATRNVTIVGHSMGAIVAATYAARYPDEVTRLVLAGTPVFRNPEEARQRIRSMSPLAALFSINPFFAREGCMTIQALRPVLLPLLPLLMKDRQPEVAQDALLHHWPSFRGSMQDILLRTPITDPLRRIGPKTLLVHGLEDAVTPLSRMRALARETGARLIVVAGGHHDYHEALLAQLRKPVDASDGD